MECDLVINRTRAWGVHTHWGAMSVTDVAKFLETFGVAGYLE